MATDIVIRSGLDRLRYALLFEGILIVLFTMVLVLVFDSGVMSTGALSVLVSLIALAVNFVYNYAFDKLDVRNGRIPTERSAGWRVIHAVGFECLLVIAVVPLLMWWLKLGFIEALLLDIVAMAGVVAYTYVFTLAYDHVFPVEQGQKESGATP